LRKVYKKRKVEHDLPSWPHYGFGGGGGGMGGKLPVSPPVSSVEAETCIKGQLPWFAGV